jgi:Holliday junction DNA helicase RuvA
LIRRIRGELAGLRDDAAMVEVAGITYEVTVSPHTLDRLRERELGGEVELATYYYMQTDPQKAIPVLLGFETEVQREFFERLIEVPKFGPRSAIRAFALPVATLAKAIEMQDARVLRSLPGVGAQRAKDIIATLSGKVTRFLSAEEREAIALPAVTGPATDFEAEALDILTQMGVPQADALRSIQLVRVAAPEITDAGEIVRRVFKH